MFKVPTTTIYSRYPLPKSLPSGGGDVLSTPLRAFSRYPLPKSLPSGEGMCLAHPLGPFYVTPSLNPSPRGRDLLSPFHRKR